MRATKGLHPVNLVLRPGDSEERRTPGRRQRPASVPAAARSTVSQLAARAELGGGSARPTTASRSLPARRSVGVSRQASGLAPSQSLRFDDDVNGPARYPRRRASWVGQALHVGLPASRRVPLRSNSFATDVQDAGMPAAATRSRVADYELLARAARRSGNQAQEAHAYMCMGILADESSKRSAALSAYSRVIELAQSLNDLAYRTCAVNAICVVLFRQATQDPSRGPPQGLVDRVLTYAEHHLSLCSTADEVDAASEPSTARCSSLESAFVAHTNMALALGLAATCSGGGFSVAESRLLAVRHCREALAAAIELSCKKREGVGLGNLAKLTADAGDAAGADAALRRHLALASRTDKISTMLEQGRRLASAGRTGDALSRMHEAQQLADKCSDSVSAERVRCGIGWVSAHAALADKLASSAGY
jgi:hypothetical protein